MSISTDHRPYTLERYVSAGLGKPQDPTIGVSGGDLGEEHLGLTTH